MKARLVWKGKNINTFRNIFGDGNVSWKTKRLYWDNKHIPRDLVVIFNYQGLTRTLKLGESFLF